MTTEPSAHNLVPFPQVPVWTFGDRIRKIRRETGLDQEAFATRIGYNGRQLAHWESGRNKPHDIVGVANAIWREYRVPASWTLGTAETPYPDGPEGGKAEGAVRREGIEPPTRWLSNIPTHGRLELCDAA